jgi:hypothetical protein
MSGIPKRGGASIEGYPPRRVVSMTYAVAPGIEPSAINAINARNGFGGMGNKTWAQQSMRLVIPVPNFPV